VIDRRGRLLVAALGFAGLHSSDRVLHALRTWLDLWQGNTTQSGLHIRRQIIVDRATERERKVQRHGRATERARDPLAPRAAKQGLVEGLGA